MSTWGGSDDGCLGLKDRNLREDRYWRRDQSSQSERRKVFFWVFKGGLQIKLLSPKFQIGPIEKNSEKCENCLYNQLRAKELKGLKKTQERKLRARAATDEVPNSHHLQNVSKVKVHQDKLSAKLGGRQAKAATCESPDSHRIRNVFKWKRPTSGVPKSWPNH